MRYLYTNNLYLLQGPPLGPAGRVRLPFLNPTKKKTDNSGLKDAVRSSVASTGPGQEASKHPGHVLTPASRTTSGVQWLHSTRTKSLATLTMCSLCPAGPERVGHNLHSSHDNNDNTSSSYLLHPTEKKRLQLIQWHLTLKDPATNSIFNHFNKWPCKYKFHEVLWNKLMVLFILK